MTLVKLGDRVRIQYCRLPEQAGAPGGTRRQQTLEFIVGSREVFHFLSVGVVGMSPGERKKFTIQPREGHGPVNRKLVRKVPRKRIPAEMKLHVGKRLRITRGVAGPPLRVRVVEIRPDAVIVDGNHPLAGKVIELDVYLMSLDSSASANRSNPQFDLGGES